MAEHEDFVASVLRQRLGVEAFPEMTSRASSIESVTLTRGMCFGTCPVYEVALHRDGSATWHGEMYTDPLGNFVGRVEGFERLARFIDRCGFFEWEVMYSTEVTDAPLFTLKVVREHDTKDVSQYATDEPPDFWVIATLIDHLASQIEWVPLPE